MKIKYMLAVTMCVSAINAWSLTLESGEDNTSAVIRLSAPVLSNVSSETFGSPLDTTLPKVTLAQLVNESETHLSNAFQLETKISKVCQKKGCFFIAQQGNDVMRVAFKDYGFFIPTDSNNKTVTLSGELIKKTMTDEQVAHFNQDMQSESDAIKEGVVYEILADSVTIPRV